MNHFKDKVAIVTGGGMGLGRALSKELARRGAVIVAADIRGEEAANVAREIEQAGGRARAVTIDVSKPEDADRMVREATSTFGRLDFIFNNAAIAIGGDTRDLTIEQYTRVIDVDLLGVVYGSLAAYRIMTEQNHGHIVNISSLGGLVPQPANTPYSTSKWGVIGFSLALRFEGCDLGVKVSCVCPGDMKTDIYKNLTVVNLDQSTIEADSRRTHFLLPQWTPEHAANVILKGVSRNQAMIVFPWIGRMAWRLHRFVPPLIYWITFKRLRMFRAMREQYLKTKGAIA